MTGGMPEAAGNELSGASPISEAERLRERERFEQEQREASRLLAGCARDAADFYWLSEAADLPASREFLAEVRALPRAGAA